MNKEDLKDFCELNKRELIESKIDSFKIRYLGRCGFEFWDDGDNSKSLEFDQHVYELFINYESSFIDSSLISDLVNLSYRWINSQKDTDALFAIESFIESTCKDCRNISTDYTDNNAPAPEGFFVLQYILDLKVAYSIINTLILKIFGAESFLYKIKLMKEQ